MELKAGIRVLADETGGDVIEESNDFSKGFDRFVSDNRRYYLLANARRICNSEYQRKPNWALARELFATGSNSAHQICLDAAIEPDGFKVERTAAQGADLGR